MRAPILLCLALSLGVRAEPDTKTAAQQKQQNNAAAAAAGAGAVIVATQVDHVEDPFAFQAPNSRARQWLGYASPWTLLILASILTGGHRVVSPDVTNIISVPKRTGAASVTTMLPG